MRTAILDGMMQFLSTPSARRATSSRKQAAWFRNYFYPRPPRGGRPPLWRSLRASAKISIHALREEGDILTCGIVYSWVYFYPRPPRGGRPDTLLMSA